jgi:hypothetical protein
VPPRTWIAALLVPASILACRAPPEARCPDRERALAAAMGALARSREVEAPRAILSAFGADGVCASDRLDRRVRCHLARPTVEVASSCARGGWTFVLYLPELSDHVHRAHVWRRGGELAVDLECEN